MDISSNAVMVDLPDAENVFKERQNEEDNERREMQVSSRGQRRLIKPNAFLILM